MYVRVQGSRSQHTLPRVSNYTYLGVDFACNGAWDVHIQKVRDNCSYIV